MDMADSSITDPTNYLLRKETTGDLEHISDWLFMLTDYLEYQQWVDADRISKLVYSCFGNQQIHVMLCAHSVSSSTPVHSFVRVGMHLSAEGAVYVTVFNVPLYIVNIQSGTKVKSHTFSDIQLAVNYVRMLII
jgi:hypothetical protein